MKKILLIALFSTNLFSQESRKNIYVDDKEDYSLFIEKTTTVSTQIIEGTEMDVFVDTKNNIFNYTILISKITNNNFTNGNLLNDDYEKYLQENCNCTLLDSEIVLYNNLKSLRHKIRTKKNSNYFLGYIDSFVSNSVLYNVLFLVYEKDFNTMSQKYSSTMNSLIINGKTTIDNYKEYEIKN